MEKQTKSLISVKGNQQLVTLSKEAWLKECSPLNIARICRKVNSIEKVFEADLPSLAKVRKQYGADFTEAYIAIWITNLVDFVSVGKKMGEQQIYETAMFIAEEYFMLTIADINMVFQGIKKGKYGQLYDRIDGTIILSCFKQYFDERCATAESISLREHDKTKKDTFERYSGSTKSLIKEASDRYKKEQLTNLKK